MPRVMTATGIGIGYEEAGEGGHMPIVFLHGVGSDTSVWRSQLGHFAPDRRAVAFDYPGYGDSDSAPEGTSRDDYAGTILAAMDALGIGQAHVCGLSLGGVVAISMYAAWPERIASLILADTFAEHPDGRAIYERSLAGSADMRMLAESRVDVLLVLTPAPFTTARLPAARESACSLRAASTCTSPGRPPLRCEAKSSTRWPGSI